MARKKIIKKRTRVIGGVRGDRPPPCSTGCGRSSQRRRSSTSWAGGNGPSGRPRRNTRRYGFILAQLRETAGAAPAGRGGTTLRGRTASRAGRRCASLRGWPWRGIGSSSGHGAIGGWSGRRRGSRHRLSGVRKIIHRRGGNGSGPAFPRPPDPCGLRLIMPYYVQRSSSERAGG